MAREGDGLSPFTKVMKPYISSWDGQSSFEDFPTLDVALDDRNLTPQPIITTGRTQVTQAVDAVKLLAVRANDGLRIWMQCSEPKLQSKKVVAPDGDTYVDFEVLLNVKQPAAGRPLYSLSDEAQAKDEAETFSKATNAKRVRYLTEVLMACPKLFLSSPKSRAIALMVSRSRPASLDFRA